MSDIINLLANFTFHTQWNAGILLMVLLSTVFYLFLLPNDKTHPTYKSILFIFGLLLIFVSVGSPLNLLGRIIFRAHIIQLIILLLIVAPLLILGFKSFIIEKAYSYQWFKTITRVFNRPKVNIAVFHSLFLFYHIPVIFNFIRMSYFLNYFYLLLLFLAALVVWLPLLSVSKEQNSVPNRNKVIYSIVNGILFVPVCLILVFSNDLLYPLYTDPELLKLSLEVCLPVGQSIETIPEEFFDLLLPFSPMKEQWMGGLLLLGFQGILFGGLALYFKRKE